MKLSILLLLAALSSTYGYHILVSFVIPSHSHNQLGKGIVDALLKGGHTVTWITPYPEKVGKNPPKTLNIIDVNHVKHYANFDMTNKKNIERGVAFVKEFSENVTREVFTHAPVIERLVNTQFDAVVTEVFFSDVLAGLAAVQQAPWIQMCAMQLTPLLEAQVDEVRSANTIPLLFNDASIPMTLKERLINLGIAVSMSIGNWFSRPTTAALYERLFAPIAARRNVQLPPFEDAYYNVSILFVNTHESLYPAFTVPPNVIGIAGYHIDENPPPLPKDLQDLLDKAKEGVVYFSMGSVVKSAAFPAHTRKALLAKFAALPYTVLWKFEEEMEEELPPNVHIRKWFPQLSVLIHPNVKVFITHGGQLSSLEAIRAGVPLLAVPVFGDQPGNAERAKKAGFGLKVPFDPNMADELDKKLRELLSNPSYAKRMKELSQLFKDRPVSPSKLVNHYIELAIRTKGAYHLRSVSQQYSWIQLWMLDLLLAIIAALAVIITLLAVFIRFAYTKLCGKSNKAQKEKKKKKN